MFMRFRLAELENPGMTQEGNISTPIDEAPTVKLTMVVAQYIKQPLW